MIATTLGGIGLFLIGMILLTEGIKAAAGAALRDALQRFTRGPFSAFASGALLTAVVQSSSATTLTTIGFVSAGLLTFPQAVGVILGANVGTTSTGWLVSLLGLKVQISAVALPLVGLGALARLLGRGRVDDIGSAVAGFGLIFVGIDFLQLGMSGLADRVDLTAFPADTLGGKTALVAVGVVMTVMMQSSSAAVATTLTALHSQAIGLEQAAILVIGQNIGTTVTAALAAVGASIPARRTAAAHILFNVLAAAVAMVVLRLLLPFMSQVAGEGDPAVAIALFHTSFNLLGVIVLFPFLRPFARLVERMIRDDDPSITRYLDRSVGEMPPIAVEAARQATDEVARLLFQRLSSEVRPEGPGATPPGDARKEVPAETTRRALEEIRAFLATVRTSKGAAAEFERHLSVLHALDHLDRIEQALDGADGGIPWRDGPLAAAAHELAQALLPPTGTLDPVELGRISLMLAQLRKEHRARVLKDTAAGEITPDAARREIEWIKRVDRLGYHAWQGARHLALAVPAASADRSGGASGSAPDSEVFEDAELNAHG
jgi:phosphate:Na+ symporter